LIAALQASGVRQAAFFVNPGRLDLPDGVHGLDHIDAYVRAGHVIANHSFSHRRLSAVDAQSYLDDIAMTEKWLANRPGYRPWFRFPYLDEGGADKAKRDAVRRGLKDMGLRNGYVTADGSDWHLEKLAIDAATAGKAMDMEALRRLYVASQLSGVEYHDELARRTLGRSPAHVLLLHETDLAALFIGDLVDELRRHGWTIISADEAFADPIAAFEPDVPFAAGTLTGSIAWQNDVKPPLWPIWMGPALISFQFERRVLKEQPPAAPQQ
jgi:peptidoglycan/xylan/chitin deacetylase (PgdA/CDA1 family)